MLQEDKTELERFIDLVKNKFLLSKIITTPRTFEDLKHDYTNEIAADFYKLNICGNYLDEDEMYQLERIVSAYLDLAEGRARRHIPMTMEDWSERLDIFLQADDRELMKDSGKISAQIAKDHALSEYEKFRVIQDREFLSDYDRYLLELDNMSGNHDA